MSKPSSSSLRIERRGAIEIVTLDRPARLNAVDIAMAESLHDYFLGLGSRLDVRVVVLRSEGKTFCAGADLDSLAFAPGGAGRPQRQLASQRLYSGIIRHMRACPQPIITLVQGAACGAGFSLALASDVRYATPDAKMNAAYLRVGLGGCDMGAGYLLPRLVGLSIASEFLMSGRFIGAQRAQAIGLVSEIVAPEELLSTGLSLAEDMLKASPMGLRLTKETLNATIDAGSLDAGLMLEDRQQVILLETADHREAVSAFKEKRAPVYSDQ
ncbi:enoyl-CoA hydratase/carnithine racemase [Panacagrimonas perspica]|uniref:Enoyl-CoA hydratase/carnithine racemase n=1 Tax=Panacagrimonas perspica TaxID=381431 RepID=A0A4R7PEC9_9GAMM|nr:enoyl-CoA hydratase-related protein [Panacagrimonas perspica]TDU31931.1 enoyl-CoA hydratase/carnithine racemase [Panacagrimonas perspica]THD04249.1 enoyl-CoA hydratase [Panacagrimonas perspica]